MPVKRMVPAVVSVALILCGCRMIGQQSRPQARPAIIGKATLAGDVTSVRECSISPSFYVQEVENQLTSNT